jgi:hypothetical protein
MGHHSNTHPEQYGPQTDDERAAEARDHAAWEALVTWWQADDGNAPAQASWCSTCETRRPCPCETDPEPVPSIQVEHDLF